MTLVLASSSPRRRELLRRFGVPFEVVASAIEERKPSSGESPAAYAVSLAIEKATEVARWRPDDVVLGADTVVSAGDLILGKPGSPEDAVRMLRLLRGRVHEVVTGVAVVCGESVRSSASISRVRLRDASDDELLVYVRTGEPMDKAGAYAIQGMGGTLVESVQGCYNAVVGLPLQMVKELLAGCGIEPDLIECCSYCSSLKPD